MATFEVTHTVVTVIECDDAAEAERVARRGLCQYSPGYSAISEIVVAPTFDVWQMAGEF